jgi:hypothetical protein
VRRSVRTSPGTERLIDWHLTSLILHRATAQPPPFPAQPPWPSHLPNPPSPRGGPRCPFATSHPWSLTPRTPWPRSQCGSGIRRPWSLDPLTRSRCGGRGACPWSLAPPTPLRCGSGAYHPWSQAPRTPLRCGSGAYHPWSLAPPTCSHRGNGAQRPWSLAPAAPLPASPPHSPPLLSTCAYARFLEAACPLSAFPTRQRAPSMACPRAPRPCYRSILTGPAARRCWWQCQLTGRKAAAGDRDAKDNGRAW